MQVSLEKQAAAKIDASMPEAWTANLISAANIKPTKIDWVWPGWIAGGKLSILAGAGGTGKTTLALGLIATLTSGGRWPDGERCTKPGNVIMWSSEDDPADTLVPRLIAAGADLDRVHFIDCRINEKGEKEPFDPAGDIDLLRLQAARMGGFSLLLLDPIVSAIKGDMHKANDVRRGLQGVVDFASEYGAAVIGISHFAKGTAGGDPTERVIGSQAFSALARTVLVAAKQKESDVRVLARSKSNIAVDDGGVSYTIEPCTIDGGIESVRVMWGDRIEGSAREILADVEGDQDDGKTSEFEDACEFITDTLSSGEMPVKEFNHDASCAGYSTATIKRARKSLGVIAKKSDMDGGWTVSLPAANFAKGFNKTLKGFRENCEPLQESLNPFADSLVEDAEFREAVSSVEGEL